MHFILKHYCSGWVTFISRLRRTLTEIDAADPTATYFAATDSFMSA